MAAQPSVTTVGHFFMGFYTKGWNVTVSFALLRKSILKSTWKHWITTSYFFFCGKCHFKCELFIVPMCFKWIFQYANNILMKTTSVAESVLYGLWYDSSALSCRFWGNLVLEWTDEHTVEVWHFSSLGSQDPLFALHFICLGSLLLENLIINLNLTPFIAAAGRSALFSQSYSQQVLIPCSLFFFLHFINTFSCLK